MPICAADLYADLVLTLQRLKSRMNMRHGVASYKK